MLSKKDITLLRGMFDQKLDDLKVDLRDEIHSCLSASEKRMMKHFEDRLSEVKTEIIDGVTDVLDEFVFPQILELQTDMVHVKNRLQMT